MQQEKDVKMFYLGDMCAFVEEVNCQKQMICEEDS